ncbi:MAG: Na+/H+ antiporter NhaA, partial [Cellvibrionaceae bacterium]
MSQTDKKAFLDGGAGSIHAPLEKGLNKIVTPFERFVNHQATAGLLLMATALIALIVANSPLLSHYQQLLQTQAGFQIGGWALEKSVHHWINDGLMALFFFVVGLELKREILVGELANLRMAILPIAAAIGGMLVPALVYVMINLDGGNLKGWGIPMATDIAFALGVIALLAARVPKALITFLVAVAIVDDLGAVMVIALFYTDTLVWGFLLAGAGLTGLMIIANLAGIRGSGIYFILGVLLWFVLLKSGVHATLAGVITAFTIPALPRFNPDSFSQRMRQLLDKFDHSYKEDGNILKNQDMAALVQRLGDG